MTNKATVEEMIVALNQYKRRKPDEDVIVQVNDLQRRLEAMAGVTAIELDEVYDSE